MGTTTEPTVGTTTWLARGSAGTVGTIHRDDRAFRVRVFRDDSERGPFSTLQAAQGAMRAAVVVEGEHLEFIAH